MARVVVLRQWPDEESLQVIVEVDGQHPDVLDEACTRAKRLYAETLGVTIESFGGDEDTA